MRVLDRRKQLPFAFITKAKLNVLNELFSEARHWQPHDLAIRAKISGEQAAELLIGLYGCRAVKLDVAAYHHCCSTIVAQGPYTRGFPHPPKCPECGASAEDSYAYDLVGKVSVPFVIR